MFSQSSLQMIIYFKYTVMAVPNDQRNQQFSLLYWPVHLSGHVIWRSNSDIDCMCMYLWNYSSPKYNIIQSVILYVYIYIYVCNIIICNYIRHISYNYVHIQHTKYHALICIHILLLLALLCFFYYYYCHDCHAHY